MRTRRSVLAAMGAVPALLAPAAALALDPADVSQPPRSLPPLLGTRERAIGDPVALLPRAAVLRGPLDLRTCARLERRLMRALPGATEARDPTYLWHAVTAAPPFARLRFANDFVNRARYRPDRNRDPWADADELFARGGDCEDFAIAKYKVLRQMGFHPERLRLVLVRDTQVRRQHALMAAYVEDRVWLLDSRVRRVVEQAGVDHYRPYVSLSERQMWRHAAA